MKSFEVMFESYPQLVLNVFIMLNLQIYTRPLNLASAMISVLSILYGISDTITFNTYYNLEELYYVKLAWALLTITLDTLFRTLFIAYSFLIFKFYTFFLPLVYFLAMIVCIFISKKKCSINFMDDFIGILYSFISNAYEDKENVVYSFRFLSKLVFNILAVITLICLGIFYHQYPSKGFDLEMETIPSSPCLDICHDNSNSIEPSTKNCDTLPTQIHNFANVILWAFWTLSSFEGILESFCQWMPYRKFYKNTENSLVSLNEMESCL